MAEEIKDDRLHRFFIVDNDFYDAGMASQLPAAAVVVYGYLLRCERNKRSWPGIDKIASMCGCGRSTVIRAISELERLKLIKIEHATGRTNTYLIRDKSEWRTSVKLKRVSNTDGFQSDTPPVSNLDGTSLNLTRDQSQSDTLTRLKNKTKEQNQETRPIRAKKATGAPDVFLPTDEQRDWARDDLGLEGRALDRETEQFLDFHRARGTTFKDWDAGWRAWLRKSVTLPPLTKQAKGETMDNIEAAFAEMRGGK